MNSRARGIRLALSYSLTERADIVGADCNQRDRVHYYMFDTAMQSRNSRKENTRIRFGITYLLGYYII